MKHPSRLTFGVLLAVAGLSAAGAEAQRDPVASEEAARGARRNVGAAIGLPDPRFGLDSASLSIPGPGELSPSSGAPRLNKSLFHEAGFIVSPDNRTTWAKFEINGSNPSQFIQSNRGYYVRKDSLRNWAARPSWISDQDILGLGYNSWAAIPGHFPVWSDAAVRYDSVKKAFVKIGFPMGTGVYEGWRDVYNACIAPMTWSRFRLETPTGTKFVDRMVLRGAYWDAAPSPEGYIKPCQLRIHQAGAFHSFVERHAGSGMTYIIFNEMPRHQIGMDGLDPDMYVFAYRYYWNMIKGHPGCNGVLPHAGWDPDATVMVGTGGQGWTGGLWGDAYTWMRKFHERWILRGNQCSPSGPVQVFTRDQRPVVPSDGVPFYYYVRGADLVDIDSPEDVCTAYKNWQIGVTNVANLLQAPVNQLFSNNTPLLKEFGIHRGKEPDGTPRPNEKVLDNPLMGALSGKMVRFLREGGMESLNISSANWLTTYDYSNWKESQATIPLARRDHPTNGTQTFLGPHGGFATTLLDAIYHGVRGEYPYTQLDFCTVP